MRRWILFHKRLAALLAVLLITLSCFVARSIKLDEDMSALIPSPIKKEMELFSASALHRKTFLGVQATTALEAQRALMVLQQELDPFLLKPFEPGVELGLDLLHALPYRFSEEDKEELGDRITPPGLADQMQKNKEKLFSLDGFFLRKQVISDPLDLTQFMIKKLSLFQTAGVEYEEGALVSKDGLIRLAMVDTTFPAAHFQDVRRFDRAFKRAVEKLGNTAHAFYLGAVRYTAENVEAIHKDLVKISVLAVLGLIGIFFLFFRHKTALLIYLLPVVILPPAAVVTALIFGRLSGITLGFGSVVAGLSIDYVIYIFFAMRYSGDLPYEAAQRLKKHLGCNFLTSAMCFVALFFSGVEVFRQIAVFSLLALSLSLWLTLYVLPAYFTALPKKTAVMYASSQKGLSKREAIFVAVCLLLFGAFGVQQTHFNEELNGLNGFSAKLLEDKQRAEPVLGNAQQNNGLLFVLGHTLDEAQAKNEQLARQLGETWAVNEVLPSVWGQVIHKQRWKNFWTTDRVQYTRLMTEEEALKQGLNAKAFEPFFEELLQESLPPDTFDFTKIYNPFVTLSDGTYGVANLVPDEAKYRDLGNEKDIYFLSSVSLQKKLSLAIRKEAVTVVIVVFLLNLFAVWGVFKNWKYSLLTFVPVLAGACMIFGGFAIWRIQVNLFVLIFLPLLMGLGIDYGIFQVMKYTHPEQEKLYPNRALLAAGLSTLVGFGVLAVAMHPVLKMMGVSALFGITGAALGALFLLPPFLEERK